MITMLDLGSHGRLGNQLFQYATLLGVSKKLNYELKLPNINNKKTDGQQCLLTYFNIDANYITQDDRINYTYSDPKFKTFNPSIFEIQDNTNIHGLFQSYLYFDEYYNDVKTSLQFRENKDDYFNNKINKYKKDYNVDKLVSLHIRRGDFTDGTISELANFYGKNDTFQFNSFYGKYLKKVISKLDTYDFKYKFLVFTGGTKSNPPSNTLDLNWCKENLSFLNPIYSEEDFVLDDFGLMMHCDINVVTPNTTFSWWTAYLNSTPNKIVLCCKNNIFDDINDYAANRSTPDLHPDYFIEL